jgi:phenol 2-monooxygenase
MNVSMADAFNLGWKLAAVLRGQAKSPLLETYSAERHAKAQELIDFDKDMARLFSAKPKDAGEATRFQEYFKKHGRYTAGVETRYDPSDLVGDAAHQGLASGLRIGARFHSAPVIRLSDGLPLQLGHVLRADGRWRLIAFAGAGDEGHAGGAMALLCTYLQDNPNSPLRRTPKGAENDSFIDIRAVFQQSHHDLDLTQMPGLLRPAKGMYGLTDYEKIFCVDPGDDIYERRGIERGRGALVVVRPDQFVADVMPLSAFERLEQWPCG